MNTTTIPILHPLVPRVCTPSEEAHEEEVCDRLHRLPVWEVTTSRVQDHGQWDHDQGDPHLNVHSTAIEELLIRDFTQRAKKGNVGTTVVG